MPVYFIDFRTNDDSVLMHIASSLEKALAWCRTNENLSELTGEPVAWYAIIKDVVDGEITDNELLGFVTVDGQFVQELP